MEVNGAIIGALIAFTGVGLSQIVTALLRRQDRNWSLQDEQRAKRIDRGEEAYALITKWKSAYFSNYLDSSLVMKGHIDYNQYLDSVIKKNENVDLRVDRIELIYSVYFHDLHEDWKSCLNLVQKTSKIQNEFKDDYKTGLQTGEQKLHDLSRSVDSACGQIDRSLLNLGKAIRDGSA